VRAVERRKRADWESVRINDMSILRSPHTLNLPLQSLIFLNRVDQTVDEVAHIVVRQIRMSVNGPYSYFPKDLLFRKMFNHKSSQPTVFISYLHFDKI